MPAMPIQDVRLDLIDRDPGQPRKSHDPEALRRLAATIKTSGLEQPIRVRAEDDRFIIVHGERRWRASRLAGLESIPCIVEAPADSGSSVRIRQLTENCAREDIPTLELADAIQAAITEDGLSATHVALHIGYSEGHVAKLRAICKAPDDVRQAVQRGELSIAAAYELTRRIDSVDPTQLSTLATSPDGRLSREALTRKLKRVSRTRAQGDKEPSHVTASLGGGRSFTLKGRKLSLDTLIEALDQLLARARQSKSQGVSLAAFSLSLRKPGNA
jgi:ParB family chromosome partitioning protein